MGHRRAGGLIVVAALVVAACGGDDGSGGDDASGDALLRYGLEMEVNLSDTFDPAASRSACDQIVMDFIYDTLIRIDDAGQPVGGLAESFELDEEGMTIVLRSGLTFHDGTTLDAAAVKAGLEHNQTGEQTGSNLGGITSIEVVDELTVRLTLDQPDATLPFTLSGREGMIVAPAALEADTAGTDPVGAGPFSFESFSPGQSIVLRANPDHWNAEAWELDGIEFVQVGVGPPAVTALRSEAIDITGFFPESLPDIEADSKLAMASTPTEQYKQLQFRISRPNPENRDEPIPTVFADPLVRMAVNHAIDRERFNEIVLSGQGEIAWMPFPTDSPAHDPDLVERYPHDPARARQLLAEAGLPDGFEFEMVIPGGGIASQERQAELIQADLAEVGITATITRSTEIAPEYYIAKQGEAFSADRLPSTTAIGQLRDQWGAFQFVAVHNGAERDDITDLVNRARATIDVDERDALVREAVAVVVDEALDVPIVFTPSLVAWNSERIEGTPTASRSACLPDRLEGVSITR